MEAQDEEKDEPKMEEYDTEHVDEPGIVQHSPVKGNKYTCRGVHPIMELPVFQAYKKQYPRKFDRCWIEKVVFCDIPWFTKKGYGGGGGGGHIRQIEPGLAALDLSQALGLSLRHCSYSEDCAPCFICSDKWTET